MIKSMYLTFTEEEFKRLERARDRTEAKSWEKFILELIER